jgi:hypothetical protein
MGPFGRAAILGVGAGVAIGVWLAASTGWPTYLAIAVGAFVGLVLLVIAASLGDDPAAADEAWRAAASDLYETDEAND